MAKITNEMIYKTADERVMAFIAYCKNKKECDHDSVRRDCPRLKCMMEWLALEAEEKPEPCFYCSHEIHVYKADGGGLAMICDNCGYCPTDTGDFAHDVAAHNRVARAVRAAREGDVK